MPDRPFDSLTSPRLTLRRFRRDDVAALCAYRADPQVARYQSWEFYGPDDAAALIEEQHDREPGVPGAWLQLAIVETATGRMIGDCGLHCLAAEPRQFELGITLAAVAQGRGYAAETIGRLLPFLFREMDAHRVSAVTDAMNTPAASLFRRLGFRQEAHFVEHLMLKGRVCSEFAFALLRREWEDDRR
jgi:RimJ/RimL family protein N-acetyltransferase